MLRAKTALRVALRIFFAGPCHEPVRANGVVVRPRAPPPPTVFTIIRHHRSSHRPRQPTVNRPNRAVLPPPSPDNLAAFVDTSTRLRRLPPRRRPPPRPRPRPRSRRRRRRRRLGA